MDRKGTVLITGASAGIGEALARVFASKGHDLVLVARSEGQLRALAEDLASTAGVRCAVMAADLANTAGVLAVLDQIQEQGIEVDILINNVGFMCEGSFWEVSLEKQQTLIQLNITTTIVLTHRLLAKMVERGYGHIMNVSSISGFVPTPNLGTYAASKAFMLSFTQSLGMELEDTGVKATALCPGFTDTAMIASESGGDSKHLPFIPNLSASEVAAMGYRACMRGRHVYITGWGNRLAVLLVRLTPSCLRRVIYRSGVGRTY